MAGIPPSIPSSSESLLQKIKSKGSKSGKSQQKDKKQAKASNQKVLPTITLPPILPSDTAEKHHYLKIIKYIIQEQLKKFKYNKNTKKY